MSNNSTIDTEVSAAVDGSIHPVVKRTGDFSDRLSPMLVKELRQGLKGITFVVLFIAIQVILGFFILGSAFSSSYDNTGQSISTIVFYLLCMVTLIAQPIRGISAISSEIKEDTIDLMVMTKLSAWRIVYGKWISIVSQSALLITAVTPYLIVRYFFGGMQLFPEIMVLISIFLLSACFTGITVGISAISSLILRGIISAALAIIVFSFCNEIFDSRGDYQDLLNTCSMKTANDTALYFSLLIAAIYTGWLALDFGASHIAPAAENRATPRRIISIAFMTITSIFIYFNSTSIIEGLPFLLTLIAIPISIISLNESSFLIPSVSAGFLRRNFFAKFSRYTLYPGWHSGLILFLVLYVICILSIVLLPPRSSAPYIDDYLTLITITFSCILFPLTLVKIFFAKKQHIFPFYIGSVIAVAVLFTVTMFIFGVTKSDDLAPVLFWLPPMQYYMYFESEMFNSSYRDAYGPEYTVLIISFLCLAVNWIICFLRSIPVWKDVRKNEEQAKEIIKDITSEEI